MTNEISIQQSLSTRQCSALLGLSLRSFERIKDKDQELVCIGGGQGKADHYPAKEFGEWLRARDAVEVEHDIDPVEVARAQALEQIGKGRKMMAEAGIKENDLKVRQQLYGEIEIMSRILGKLGTQIRTQIESLPSRMVAKYDWVTAEQVDMLKTECAEMMNDIAELDEDWFVLASRAGEEYV